MQTQKKAVGFVRSHQDKGSALYLKEVNSQLGLIKTSSSDLDLKLVAVYGDLDVAGSPATTTLDDALTAIETSAAEILIINSCLSIGPSGFVPLNQSDAFLLNVRDRLKNAGASVTTLQGPSFDTVIDGILHRLNPGQKLP